VNDNKPLKRTPLERWEIFLRTLNNRVSAPSETHPTVRCWKQSALSGEIKAVIREKQSELLTTFPPAYQVIEHLKRMGWAQPIKTQSPGGSQPIEFLLVDTGSAEGPPISPLELLQAWLPTGTICYLSALTYHELTTQSAAHHHIARLNPHRPRKEPAEPTEPEKGSEPVERNPLGTEVFRFAKVSYYETRRDASLVPGIQMRVASPKTWLRITTLEQTLLDTLLQPVRCGGEAVILEAWENGIKEIDADRMAKHLSEIQREDLERRVAAVLDIIGANMAATSLGRRLQGLRERLAAAAQEVLEIPLLPGFEFANLSGAWKVRAP
jgi:hypothetical protein